MQIQLDHSDRIQDEMGTNSKLMKDKKLELQNLRENNKRSNGKSTFTMARPREKAHKLFLQIGNQKFCW